MEPIKDPLDSKTSENEGIIQNIISDHSIIMSFMSFMSFTNLDFIFSK